MADARREWVQPASCSRKMAMIFLKSRVTGNFPQPGTPAGKLSKIPFSVQFAPVIVSPARISSWCGFVCFDHC
jgi:hypothetical protein